MENNDYFELGRRLTDNELDNMMQVNFDLLFANWRKVYPNIAHTFYPQHFLRDIINRMGWCIPYNDHNVYTGIDFAKLMYKTNGGWIDCAFCSKYLDTIQRVKYNKFVIKLKN